jgi:hypothetical protein
VKDIVGSESFNFTPANEVLNELLKLRLKFCFIGPPISGLALFKIEELLCTS